MGRTGINLLVKVLLDYGSVKKKDIDKLEHVQRQHRRSTLETGV